MKIIDVNDENEGCFYNCGLVKENPEASDEDQMRKAYIKEYPGQGLKLMIADDGTVVGRLHYVPIELSPLIGDNILVILCLYIHMYKHNVGDWRRLLHLKLSKA